MAKTMAPVASEARNVETEIPWSSSPFVPLPDKRSLDIVMVGDQSPQVIRLVSCWWI